MNDEATFRTLRSVARVAPVLINQRSKPGPHCVLATSVGVSVLAKVGLHAEPYPVVANIWNQAWQEMTQKLNAGVPTGDPVQLGAHLISNDPEWEGPTLPSLNPPTGRAWDGHLVLTCDGYLVDLDLGSFNRPMKQIVLPPAVVAPLSPQREVHARYVDGESVTYVSYKPLVAKFADGYLTSRDWRERDRYVDLVDCIVDMIQ